MHLNKFTSLSNSVTLKVKCLNICEWLTRREGSRLACPLICLINLNWKICIKYYVDFERVQRGE